MRIRLRSDNCVGAPIDPDSDTGRRRRDAPNQQIEPLPRAGPPRPRARRFNDGAPGLRRRDYGTPIPDCIGDIDGDGVVGILEFLQLLSVWGTADPFADIAPDGGDLNVDIEDLLLLLANWGQCD